MRYKLPFAGLALVAAFLSGTEAQTPDRPKPGNLDLRLQPGPLEGGVPQAFSFVLVNHSDHDVRLPLPAIGCENSYDGAVQLRLDFTPVESGPPGERGGCAGDRWGWPAIMDRVKEWKVLHSGEALTLTADRAHLFYDDSKRGAYEFWAVYSPPYLTVAEQKKLQELGIDFPHDNLRSDRLTFVK